MFLSDRPRTLCSKLRTVRSGKSDLPLPNWRTRLLRTVFCSPDGQTKTLLLLSARCILALQIHPYYVVLIPDRPPLLYTDTGIYLLFYRYRKLARIFCLFSVGFCFRRTDQGLCRKLWTMRSSTWDYPRPK